MPYYKVGSVEIYNYDEEMPEWAEIALVNIEEAGGHFIPITEALARKNPQYGRMDAHNKGRAYFYLKGVFQGNAVYTQLDAKSKTLADNTGGEVSFIDFPSPSKMGLEFGYAIETHEPETQGLICLKLIEQSAKASLQDNRAYLRRAKAFIKALRDQTELLAEQFDLNPFPQHTEEFLELALYYAFIMLNYDIELEWAIPDAIAALCRLAMFGPMNAETKKFEQASAVFEDMMHEIIPAEQGPLEPSFYSMVYSRSF